MKPGEIKNLIVKEVEAAFNDVATSRDAVINYNLNVAVNNNALLQLIIANQAQIFSVLFPSRTIEEHTKDMLEDIEVYTAEAQIKLINNLNKDQE